VKTASEVSPEKLRGGFYTPADLVDFCLRRAAENAPKDRALRLLEPSIGDGAFVRGLHDTPLHGRIEQVLGLEVLEIEAEKARQALRASSLDGEVRVASAIQWAADETDGLFDIAVGNPPFVRFQFVEDRDRTAIDALAGRLGLSFRRVSNLWIPLLIAALSRLRAGGAVAFVVPTECFTGCSAQVARDWLLANVEELHFDLFQPGSFPGVLQEIAVVSGRRAERREGPALPTPRASAPTASASAQIRISEHDASGQSRSWNNVACAGESWTRYLLEPKYLDALAEARALPTIGALGDAVAFEVSIVTGANDFFTVDQSTLDAYELAHWARPLLPRARHAEGLVYESHDQDRTVAAGARAWLLDFSEGNQDPQQFAGASSYLQHGETRLLHERYKCRIRSPWYRVPGIRSGELLLSKRSHTYPRVTVNRADVFTTDTIYRGRMLAGAGAVGADALAATFHNSLTLLTAEIEGRSFGGGVLELVPSEVGRLSVPLLADARCWLGELDAAVRSGTADAVIAATDARLIAARAIPRRLLETLAEARLHMLARRLDRNAVDASVEHDIGWRKVA
jgi:adenine-specific DNA-methyltransferase